eukprot:gnl/TRDRNA2_/TRDRNA2_185532_c0_seq1.p1 gnl/TRDRNA2_/TRDRNA2_185532_c0~~gnl/TRDRNA2_/TRDRNA2_185532_c0_seq1.p1  ORF type:complete len:367 (-),score=74.03 gnl/TRDRNA2_/TRDRNA2_185532_c0_seq1:151-1179(-)
MSSTGPGPVICHDYDLPWGWEAFWTNDNTRYALPYKACKYYYCRSSGIVQWDRPGEEDAVDEPLEEGEDYISGRRPYRKGDEKIPNPPPPRPFDGPWTEEKYTASCEDPEDVFQPDEDMLEAALDCDLEKMKKALADGADVSLPNHPWKNTPLHLACSPPFWDADTYNLEKNLRLEMVQYLIRQGADMDMENAYGFKPIDLAQAHHYTNIVLFLKSQDSKMSLFGAALANDLERVIECLEEGADIDAKGRFGRTAFAEAHLKNCWQVECFLAQQGCSRHLPHAEDLKFNPGAGAIPRGNVVPTREIQYQRYQDPDWYDDMMEKKFPGYKDKLEHVSQDNRVG